MSLFSLLTQISIHSGKKDGRSYETHSYYLSCPCEWGLVLRERIKQLMNGNNEGMEQKASDPDSGMTFEQYTNLYNSQHFIDEMTDEELFFHRNLMKRAIANGRVELKHTEDVIDYRKKTGDKSTREKIRELDRTYTPKLREEHVRLSTEEKLFSTLAKSMGVSVAKAREILGKTKEENEKKEEK